jgi:hypothetical protein
MSAPASESHRPPGENGRTGDGSRTVSGPSQKAPTVYTRDSLEWAGLRLRLRISGREVCAVKPAEVPGLYRVCWAPDHETDTCNLQRARAVAVSIALRQLNAEVAHRRARVRP